MRDLYGRVPQKENAAYKQSDAALIISLIILLIKDGADNMLILALIYILT